MLNKPDFKDMLNKFRKHDEQREHVIIRSRSLIKLSKQIIYSVHRDDFSNIADLIKKIESVKKQIEAIVKTNHRLLSVGAYKVGIGEYVEALLYYNFVKNGKLPSHKKLNVSSENYLFGLCDLTGELVRKAVFLAGKGKNKEVTRIKDLVDEIYGEVLKFDVRDNDLRRKIDSIKYDLKKLEDLVLELKLRK
jgi:predicted translin family RNA/ssDNA-binding protein